jgi:hypothetical protein
MSHFTYIKTRFQNLGYLKKALNKLNISYKEKFNQLKSEVSNLSIPQPNGYDIEFAWNGQQYELVMDMSFWEQSSPIEIFIDKVAQTYATEVAVGESKKIGFQTLDFQKNKDGSDTLILERWNH